MTKQYHQHLISTREVDRCLVEVDICNNVMECACCCYFLDRKNYTVMTEILNATAVIPKQITRVTIPIYPLLSNRPYYSFNGLEKVINNLFRTQKIKHLNGLKRLSAYLKVFYEKDPLFNIPLIKIQVIFFGALHPKSADELIKKLEGDVLSLTGAEGKIENLNVMDRDDLERLLYTPLLVGYPEFKLEGPLQYHKFSNQQIREMNYMHSISLTKLDMPKGANNNMPNLFLFQRDAILKEIEDEADEIIKEMFSRDSKHSDRVWNGDMEADFENLPF